MKILICLILLALIYFIYKKVFAGDDQQGGEDASIGSDGNPTRVSDSTTADSGATAAAAATAATAAVAAAASTAGDGTAGNDTSSAQAAPAGTSSTANTAAGDGARALPIEHLVGIDRRRGRALRAQGVNNTGDLARADLHKLNAAGLDTASAKTLQAQAALSALPGVTPHEASVLASSGIDTIANLAQQSPTDLVDKLARINRSSGALKSSPGVQQLQRLISSAQAAA